MMMYKWICALIVVLLLSSPVLADAPTANIGLYADKISTILQQSTTAYVAVVVAILLAALLYMGSSIFSDVRMLAMSKDMFYQAIVSLVLIASLPVIYVVVSNITISLFFGDMEIQENDIFRVAKIYLAWNEIYFFVHMLALTALNMMISNTVHQTYTIPIGSKLVPIELISIAKPLMYAVGFGVNLLTTALLINGFQIMFLSLIESTILPIFLPLGVILRAFPATLNAGNILIAISIGAYIIAPTVFLFDMYLLKTLLSDDKTSEKLGFMTLFYHKDTLQAVMDYSKCKPIRSVLDRFINKDYTIFDKPSSLLNKMDGSSSQNGCNLQINLTKIANVTDKMPTWAKVVVGSALASKAATAFSNSLSHISSFLKSGSVSKFLQKMAFYSAVVSNFFSLALGIILMIYVIDVIESVGISFIILAVILPFLNFTIIVLFMREFSQTVLGTPLNLSHLVRLI